jgi:hypothetical protein
MDFFDDERTSGTLGGAASGAAIGSAIPGVGTGIGALVGGGLGFLSGSSSHKAHQQQQKALDEAMKRLQAFSMQSYANRMADLDKTLAFYQPANNYMASLYHMPNSTPQPTYTPGTGAAGPLGMR